MKQTAVEWYAEEFAEHLEETYGIKITNLTLLHKAKEMEKEQIISARQSGIDATIKRRSISNVDYYDETFKQQEQ